MNPEVRPEFMIISDIVESLPRKEMEKVQDWCWGEVERFPPGAVCELSQERLSELKDVCSAVDESVDLERGEKTLEERYEKYTDPEQTSVGEATLRNREKHVPIFLDFADDYDISYASEFTSSLIEKYAEEVGERRANQSSETARAEVKTNRAFINYAIIFSSCDPQVTAPLKFRFLDFDRQTRTTGLSPDRASHLIRSPGEVHYRHRHGTALMLIFNASLRIGELRALDVRDFDREEGVIEVYHRPEEGTPIKNGDDRDDLDERDCNRELGLENPVTSTLADYIDTRRSPTTDEYGRRPLFVTSQGRASLSTLRRDIYRATSCEYMHGFGDGGEKCDGTCDHDSTLCPYSVYPHAVRRGSIMYQLDTNKEVEDVSERCDVSRRQIALRYDGRSGERKRKAREASVKRSWSDFEW